MADMWCRLERDLGVEPDSLRCVALRFGRKRGHFFSAKPPIVSMGVIAAKRLRRSRSLQRAYAARYPAELEKAQVDG